VKQGLVASEAQGSSGTKGGEIRIGLTADVTWDEEKRYSGGEKSCAEYIQQRSEKQNSALDDRIVDKGERATARNTRKP
jgi:hypothetical protein